MVLTPEFNGNVHFFCFQPEIPFLGKFGPKNQNCQVELEFGTYNNLNMQNSILTFIFSIFDQKDSFWRQICSEKSKLFAEAEIWNLG